MLNETFVSFVGLIWKLCIPVEENNNSTHSYTPKQREPRSITYKNIVFFYFFLQFLVVRLTNIPDQPPSFSKNQWQRDKNDLQSKQALEAVICQTIRDCEQSVCFSPNIVDWHVLPRLAGSCTCKTQDHTSTPLNLVTFHSPRMEKLVSPAN